VRRLKAVRVLIDTNILISAIYSKGSVPHRAYIKAVEPPHQGLICEQTLEELRRVYFRKFPDRIRDYEQFVSVMLTIVQVVPVPSDEIVGEGAIRDADDRPILRAALVHDANILLTGDRDFLESGINNPRIMTATEFLQLV
jgi:putative PIN family toxin of toxin-antitoxin system